MPFGGFLNLIPPFVFILIHLAGFALGAYFSRQSFRAGTAGLGWGFALYTMAEIVYMTYHLDWTVFLFAHTIAEVLDLVGFALVFGSVAQSVLSRQRKAS